MKIEIKDLKIGKYIINLDLLDYTNYGVLSVSLGVKNDFLLLVSGLNKSVNISCEDTLLYKNKNYLKNRIYLDFKKNYLKTLNINSIEETLKENYGIKFDKEIFKKEVSTTSLRSEVKVTNEYNFSEYGINLCGYCLLKALDYKELVLNNPIINIKKIEHKKQIIEYTTNKTKFNRVITYVSDILSYKGLIDKYIIFGDYEEVLLIDPQTDTFIVTDDNKFLRNKIFKKDSIIVCLNDYTKQELKQIKQKYKIINFYDLIFYLEGEK